MSTTHHDFVIKHGLSLADNTKIKIGNSDDLQLYHDGATSIIADTGTGFLALRGDGNVTLQNAAGTENKLVASSDGAVTLYFNNSSKFATQSYGAFLSGVLLANDGSPSAPTFSFSNDSNTGMYRNSADILGFTTGGARRGYFASSGIHSDSNVYTGTGGSFRNYAGTWSATTGATGNGFNFVNSVDGTAMTLSSTGNMVVTGTISSPKVFDEDSEVPNQNLLDIGSIKISNRSDIYGNATKTTINEFKATYANDNVGPTTVRLYVDPSILVDGDTYTVSVYYEGLVGTLTLDWNDVALTGDHKSATGTTSSPASGRVYGYASRSTYDSTYRFLDINLNTGASHTVTLFNPKVEAGTQVTDFVGTERTNQEGNSKDLNNLNVTSKLGISTTAPLAPLNVVRGGSPGLSSVNARTVALFENNNSAGTVISINAPSTGYAGIFFGDGDSESVGQIKLDNTNNTLQFVSQGASPEMVIQGGNVGIGRTSASYKLHVRETTTNIRAIQVEDATSWLGLVPSLGGGGYNSLSTAGDIGIIFSTDNDSGSSASNGLVIAPHSGASGAQGIKIMESGNVGIGTTSPSQTLHIAGTTLVAQSELQITSSASYTTHLNYQNAGNNYISFAPSGTTSVRDSNDTKFSIYSSSIYSYKQHLFNNSTSASTPGIAFDGDTDTGLFHPSSNALAFSTGGNERMRINSSGNVQLLGSMIIHDTGGTRGIFRDNDSYDLRLGGGTEYSDGAYISLGGENRGGGTSEYKGRAEIFAGGNTFASQADITGNVILGARWNGGSDHILTLDSSTGRVGIQTGAPSVTLLVEGNVRLS